LPISVIFPSSGLIFRKQRKLKKIPKAEKQTVKKGKEPELASKKRKRTTINPALPKKAAKVKSRKKVKKFKTGGSGKK